MARMFLFAVLFGTVGATALAQDPSCAMFQPGSDALPSSACLKCHDATKPRNHPFDIDYAQAAAGSDDLRPLAEVIRRGVALPDGQVRCATCHDARSPWKYRIALPPGTKPTPAVNPFRPETYDGTPRPALQPGDEVTAKPLCLVCHAMD